MQYFAIFVYSCAWQHISRDQGQQHQRHHKTKNTELVVYLVDQLKWSQFLADQGWWPRVPSTLTQTTGERLLQSQQDSLDSGQALREAALIYGISVWTQKLLSV